MTYTYTSNMNYNYEKINLLQKLNQAIQDNGKITSINQNPFHAFIEAKNNALEAIEYYLKINNMLCPHIIYNLDEEMYTQQGTQLSNTLSIYNIQTLMLLNGIPISQEELKQAILNIEIESEE